MNALSPAEIVQKMMDHDAFSQWLGLEVLEIGAGHCRLKMTVRPEMVNGFGISHGGITFSFADSAFAFASNSRGQHAVSIETGISHISPVYPGDNLIASATELQNGKRLARYEVIVKREEEPVALFKGTVYKKDQPWI
ncbi:MAG TPA: hydroxyphenylacetyl-CoA thioesterase PaaI [Cryomorphaceae bacterium]|nr:hydroxyphenylacetyl-CoA thioesterase PaaI [Cryomorphaceae bacterium]